MTTTDAAASGILAENEAMMCYASYAMVDMTLGLTINNNGDNCDITTGSISYAIRQGLSVSLSAYEKNDWGASAT